MAGWEEGIKLWCFFSPSSIKRHQSDKKYRAVSIPINSVSFTLCPTFPEGLMSLKEQLLQSFTDT